MNFEIIEKQIGETPLEALERFRSTRPDLKDVPMTYAGRLDPMAEGKLLILWGEECKNKDKYLGLDKEYEVEVVFGIRTDTHDALGLAEIRNEPVSNDIDPKAFVGRFIQEYPSYSSKAFSWKGDEPPTKEVEIYSIDALEKGTIDSASLKERMFDMIDKVKGDFRQEEIKKCWESLLCHSRHRLRGDKLQRNLCRTTEALDPRVKPEDDTGRKLNFQTMKIRVKCSSGTYMRSLADRMGGFALMIKRTGIFT